MNKKLNVKNLKQREIVPGFHGRFINGENITWAFWEIEKDSSIPDHFHIHEQIMHVVSGDFEFTVNGITSIFFKWGYNCNTIEYSTQRKSFNKL